MLSVTELASTARARLKDADGLLSLGRYDGASYICGYAVEIASKARIVKTLKWPGFPNSGKEFDGLQSFRTHDLRRLLYLRGRESKILAKYKAEWADIVQCDPEMRYRPPGQLSRSVAERMVRSCQNVVGRLL